MTGFLEAPVIEAPVIESGGGYPVSKSVRFRASATPYFDRTPTVGTNRRTWTWSGWAKRGRIATSDEYLFSASNGSSAPGGVFSLWGFNLGTLYLNDHLVGTGHRILLQSSQVFRDVAGWYHVLFAVDTTQATATDRVKAYVCGAPVALSGTWPALNLDTYINDTIQHRIGQGVAGTTVYPFDGYITEVRFIDGQALTPASFGQFDVNGVWAPKAYTGTYGTNGFYLPFNDGSSTTNLGLDRSGNGNNYTATNVSLTAGPTYDWMDDTPTNNYAVLNPLDQYRTTISGGNLDWSQTGGAGGSQCSANVELPMGLSYWECKMGTVSTANMFMGVCKTGTLNLPSYGTTIYINTAGTLTALAGNGTAAANGPAFTSGSMLMFAFDRINGKMWFGVDGTWSNSGNPAAGTNANVTGIPSTVSYSPSADQNIVSGDTSTGSFNFGQRPFQYTPPSGFKALCTANMPAVTVPNGRKHFDTFLYLGDGTNGRVITPAGFDPGLAWFKARSSAWNNATVDTVRGNSKVLLPNQTAAEGAFTGYADFGASGSNQMTISYVGSGGVTTEFNNSGTTYALWLWKAGGAPVTNNNGSITSQVSANTTAGFSIVTYTGTGANATVGHGLGVAPKLVIVKKRTGTATNWAVCHASLSSAANWLQLSTTNGQSAAATVWNSAAPTSSVFSIGTAAETNNATDTYVAYCFSEIPGYSKFGSYTGNGSADGPFVFCGFRPRCIMLKRSDSTGDWFMLDTARNSANTANNYLLANSSNAEAATIAVDVLANGFKIRVDGTSWPAVNPTGGTVVYAAFAENPFGGNNVAPATAR